MEGAQGPTSLQKPQGHRNPMMNTGMVETLLSFKSILHIQRDVIAPTRQESKVEDLQPILQEEDWVSGIKEKCPKSECELRQS